MSDYTFDLEYLEVGDSLEGGPTEQGYFISAVMAAGGRVEINGDVVTILDLPKKAKAPVSVKEELVKEEVIDKVELVKDPEAKLISEYNDVLGLSEEPPLVDLAAEEPVIEVPVVSKPVVPKSPGRPRKLVLEKTEK